ncbi:hypothetical protein GCM10018783_58410 [Streptomyces griseosporeus]|nr:hypothetical protein GCM10018783_58410 [Streptomyces griseosporeus]
MGEAGVDEVDEVDEVGVGVGVGLAKAVPGAASTVIPQTTVTAAVIRPRLPAVPIRVPQAD